MKTEPKKKIKPKRKKVISDSLLMQMGNRFKKSKTPSNVFSLGDPTPLLTVKDVLSTGLPNLDRILCMSEGGKWGLPVGRIISVKSKPSVGKTTLLLRIADQAYKRGGVAHIIESEHALEISYARRVCSNVDKFFISQPETLEEAFDIIKNAINVCLEARKETKNTAPFVIIVDSFSGFTTEAESEGGFTTKGKALGEHARLAALACRKLTGPIDRAKAILVLSHQTKSKLGVFWGSKETNIGGDAFNYHDSICLNLYRTTGIKDSKDKIAGHYGLIRTSKNKLYPPHQETKFKIINGKGFNQPFSIFEFLLSEKFLSKKAGGNFWFRENHDLSWRGAENFASFLQETPKARKLVKKILSESGVF